MTKKIIFTLSTQSSCIFLITDMLRIFSGITTTKQIKTVNKITEQNNNKITDSEIECYFLTLAYKI